MNTKENGLIYKVTNLVNNKVYIGLTTRCLTDRMHDHYYDSNHNSHLSFHKAIRKYNWESFCWEVLEDNISIDLLNTKEQEYIKLYESFNPEKGYNCTTGGDSAVFRPEVIEKMAAAKRGKPLSEETKKKLSEIHKGKRYPKHIATYDIDKHKQNIRNAILLKYETDEEYRKKISANIAKQRLPENRKISRQRGKDIYKNKLKFAKTILDTFYGDVIEDNRYICKKINTINSISSKEAKQYAELKAKTRLTLDVIFSGGILEYTDYYNKYYFRDEEKKRILKEKDYKVDSFCNIRI